MARLGCSYPIVASKPERPPQWLPGPPFPPFYDNSAISAYQNTAASGVAIPWTQTGISTPGAYALVVAYGSSQATPTTTAAVAAVTFGGVTMKSLGNIQNNNSAASGFVWVWGLPAIAGGNNVSVSVTFTLASTAFQGYCCSFTYLNVGAVGALQVAASTATQPSVLVPSAVGNLVFGTYCQASSNTYTASRLTIRKQINIAGNFPNFQAGDIAGAASVNVTGTQVGGGNWGCAGLNLYGQRPLSTNNIGVAMSNSSMMR